MDLDSLFDMFDFVGFGGVGYLLVVGIYYSFVMGKGNILMLVVEDFKIELVGVSDEWVVVNWLLDVIVIVCMECDWGYF